MERQKVEAVKLEEQNWGCFPLKMGVWTPHVCGGGRSAARGDGR